MLPRQRPARRPPPADALETVQGLRAGLAAFDARPGDVVRVAFTRAAGAEVAPLVRWARAKSVPCREVSEAELDAIAGGKHHEGLCVQTAPRRWLAGAELAELLTSRGGVAVALDRVRNPYNVGAILRSAAFFGVDAALIGAPSPHPGLPVTAVRVAEGGAERVAVARTTDLADSLARLRAAGVRVVGADGKAPVSAIGHSFGRPLVVVVGHEREGLGPRIRAACDEVVGIRGGGAMESLNVGVAAGVLLAAATAQS